MKIAIYGYGNLGRGVECALQQNPDMQTVGVFTRRDPATVQTVLGTPVYHTSALAEYKDEIDVLIICGGSATDLPQMTPALAADFNVVDSFDTHAAIPTHYANVDAAATEAQLRLLPLVDALFSEVNPIPVKAAMAKMGFGENYLRLPLTPMEPQNEEKLFALMREQNLI